MRMSEREVEVLLGCSQSRSWSGGVKVREFAGKSSLGPTSPSGWAEECVNRSQTWAKLASSRASPGRVPRSIPRAGYPGGGTLPSHCRPGHRCCRCCCWPLAPTPGKRLFFPCCRQRGTETGLPPWSHHRHLMARSYLGINLPGPQSGFAFPGKVSAAHTACPVNSFSKKKLQEPYSAISMGSEHLRLGQPSRALPGTSPPMSCSLGQREVLCLALKTSCKSWDPEASHCSRETFVLINRTRARIYIPKKLICFYSSISWSNSLP